MTKRKVGVSMRRMAGAAVLAVLVGVVFSVGTARADICDEPNDRPQSACRLAPNTQVEGFIESFSDVDLYAVDLASGANLRVDMIPPGDFRVSLQAFDGSVAVPPVGEGVGPRQFRFRSPAARTYFIKVESALGDASTVLPYVVGYAIEPDGSGEARTEVAPAPPGGARPHDVILRIDEAGREAKQEYAKDGTTADGQWVEVRFERPRNFRGMRSGWVSIISRVTQANDLPTAQRIYRELAGQTFPEATEPTGPEFSPDVGKIGEEMTVTGNCQDTCIQEEPLMHMRIVFRQGTTVVVLYTWGMGGTESATAESAAWLARQMLNRIW